MSLNLCASDDNLFEHKFVNMFNKKTITDYMKLYSVRSTKEVIYVCVLCY